MNICVFCSASDVAEKYTAPAAEFAKLIGENAHTLVWGGNDAGIMGIVANGVKDTGGKLIGINMELLKENSFQNADEMIFANTLGERKALLLERADAIIVMVGGIGTLDEVTEIIELKKLGMHSKPIVFLNTDTFYAHLKQQLQKIEAEGFLKRAGTPIHLDNLVYFAETPTEAFAYITKDAVVV